MAAEPSEAQRIAREITQLDDQLNPNTPEHTIRYLVTDPDPAVATSASKGRPNLLRRYAHTLDDPARSRALLLIDQGFPGWPDDLDSIIRARGGTPPAVSREDKYR